MIAEKFPYASEGIVVGTHGMSGAQDWRKIF
jgi:hypothetical protein